MTHVLLVDDDLRLLELLGQFLHAKGYVVSRAQSAKEASFFLGLFRFDIVLLDVMLGQDDGVTLLQEMHQKNQKLPVLMLTAVEEQVKKIKAFESGADDFLQKPFDPQELHLRMQAILRRTKKNKAKDVFRFGHCTFYKKQRRLVIDGENVHIASSQMKLLQLLLEKGSEGLHRDDEHFRAKGTLEKSLDVQITRLRKKIEKDPRNPVLLQTIRNKGYVLCVDD